ncbi:MAG: hypothetical protein PHQ75_12110, partial [Thermoguttaceae bacterium]|nr:hypothetical protein [Thermoguttaceae bacterium]
MRVVCIAAFGVQGDRMFNLNGSLARTMGKIDTNWAKTVEYDHFWDFFRKDSNVIVLLKSLPG